MKQPEDKSTQELIGFEYRPAQEILNNRDYQQALSLVSALVSLDPERDTLAGLCLSEWSALVEKYEKRVYRLEDA